MANLIEACVELARRGPNQFVICRMQSGWPVTEDGPFVERVRRHLNASVSA